MKIKTLIPLSAALLMALVACGEQPGPNPDPKPDPVTGTHTYKTFTSVSPSNWNELTYEDNNDTQIMSYLAGSFFNYDFEFDANGKIIDGKFKTCFDGASGIVDATKDFAGAPEYSVPSEATKGYAYRIQLRNDLKWDDGTPIHAKDFVYSMKQQLDPLFQNYRADSFYNGSTVIHNAFNYVKQGKKVFVDNGSSDSLGVEIQSEDQLDKSGDIYTFEGDEVYVGVDVPLNYLGGDAMTDYADYFGEPFETLLDNMIDDEEDDKYGYAPLNATTLAALKASITNDPQWGETEEYFVEYLGIYREIPATDFNTVGIKVGNNEDELVVILDKPLVLLDDNGGMTYKCAYNFASLPLVKESIYEDCKRAPTTEGGLWTSTYNSSVLTSASWGPYKLTQFQAGKSYVLERNPNWYGYNMDCYKGQYQTDRIECETLTNLETIWLKFKAGDLAGVGVSPSYNNTDYKNSSRAFFTGDDYVGSLQLQSNATALKGREVSGVDKEMLTNVKFRKALSIGLDRAAYLQVTSVANQPGFGLFNEYHYYDVANGGVYRHEVPAKKTLLDAYGVQYTDANLEEKYESLTGYDPTLAKQLITEAYNEELAAGRISATDEVVLTYGSSSDTQAVRLNFDTLNNQWKELMKDTPLEGRFKLEINTSFGKNWAVDFRAGAYDICAGGWTGAAWDPGYFLLAYLSPQYMYSQAWDTSSHMLTYTPDNVSGEVTMSLIDWYDCLNGQSSSQPYNWAEGFVGNEVRLGIIAAIEKEILSVYYTVPYMYEYTAELLSYKVEYATANYNTFMGYGGIRYMTYNYNDADWEGVKGSFDYMK